MNIVFAIAIFFSIMVSKSHAGFHELAVACQLENQPVVLASCQFSNTADAASSIHTNMFSETQHISVANGIRMSNILAVTNASGVAHVRFYTSAGTASVHGCLCLPLGQSWGRYTGNIGGGAAPTGPASSDDVRANTSALSSLVTTMEANTEGSYGLASVMSVFSTDSVYFFLGIICASIFLLGIRMRL